ncbi:protein REVEILLE 8-like [Panicum miliaceum]|uniref:Protein REVEILLE 8-like n=1 Tax=Panicum miliaceum TaxID=4540 RepID=A0A3L6SWB6_PANMI|nr:protein REVEILLE 8-like [Panicum miliaceum]
MATARNNSSAGTPAAAAGKKPRKPYKITRPREKWAADEHGRFLHALLLFGRDWKPVAQFVGTKTATQVRSHAQKHFLKAQKLGLGAALPPPKPRRGAVLAAHHDDNAVAGTAAAQMWWLTPATPPTMIQLPLSPDDPRFAQVYRFVGDVFGSGAARPAEARLQRLQGVDPVVVDTRLNLTRVSSLCSSDEQILLVLRNLEDNLFA